MKNKYPNIDIQLPESHKEIIDARLEILENSPDRINPISTLMDELDK